MLNELEIQLVTKYILSLNERSDRYGDELVDHVLHRVTYLNYDDGVDWDTYGAICSFRDEFEDEARMAFVERVLQGYSPQVSAKQPQAPCHILAASQFDLKAIELVFKRAQQIEHSSTTSLLRTLQGKTLACVFYEPSTRTSASFIAAMSKLGGNVIPITQGVQYSSVSKGESLEDTILTLGQYADAIVLRHPEVGASALAAKVSPVPIINAGDGIGEHPTQALLDLYTIQREFGRTSNLKVAFVGDLANGRTIHSLATLLALYPENEFSLISPFLLKLDVQSTPYLQIKDKVVREIHVRSNILEAEEAILDADVIYMTRVQKERFGFLENYSKVKDSCLLTEDLVKRLKPSARILHPLPRVNEIPKAIDSDPRAAYFREVKMGLYVRMALLDLVMRPTSSWLPNL
jgi:aspartate carbamoyltransferase